MPRFKVTTTLSAFRVYIVEAADWQAAKSHVNEHHHKLTPESGCQTADDTEEVIFVDSEDGTHAFFE